MFLTNIIIHHPRFKSLQQKHHSNTFAAAMIFTRPGGQRPGREAIEPHFFPLTSARYSYVVTLLCCYKHRMVTDGPLLAAM